MSMITVWSLLHARNRVDVHCHNVLSEFSASLEQHNATLTASRVMENDHDKHDFSLWHSRITGYLRFAADLSVYIL